MTADRLCDALQVTCTGHGPGHGRTGGLGPEGLPTGDLTGGAFLPVRFGSGSGSRHELIIDGAHRTAWNCDAGYFAAFRMLDSCGPVYYHPETSLLVAGEPAIRRYLSIRWEPPTPCRQLRDDRQHRRIVVDTRDGTFRRMDGDLF
jgi:hypothetical protein